MESRVTGYNQEDVVNRIRGHGADSAAAMEKIHSLAPEDAERSASSCGRWGDHG